MSQDNQSAANGQVREPGVVFLPREFYPGNHDIAWKDHDAARVIVHFLVMALCNKANPQRWVSISQTSAIYLLGSRRMWERVIRALASAGVVQVNGSFRRGEWAKHYRLTNQWRKRLLVPYRLHDQDIIRRLAAIEDRKARRFLWEPTHWSLERWGRLITIDQRVAREVMSTMSGNRLDTARAIVSLLSARQPRMSLSWYGRMHSAVTRMPRELRKALKQNSQGLVMLDVHASQPLLLAYLDAEEAKRRHKADTTIRDRFLNRRALSGGKESRGGLFRPSPMPPSRILLMPGALLAMSCDEKGKADWQDWVNCCEKGTFYRELAPVLKMPFDTDEQQRRVKKTACKILFGPHRPRLKRSQRFAQRWPTFGEKSACIKAGNYKRMAGALQRAESDVMLGMVCGFLTHHHPDIPLLTVHDAILTTQDAADVVKAAITDVYAEFGATPLVR